MSEGCGCGPNSRCSKYLLDSLQLAGELRHRGPMTWKQLEMLAGQLNIDFCDFDRAIISALKTGLMHATFEAGKEKE